MNMNYSIGLCILLNILAICQGAQNIHKDGLGFAYQESGEQNENKHNAMVRTIN